MKKTITKVLSVVLVVVITLTSVPLSGFVGLELPKWLNVSIMSSAAETSGTCGDNLTWMFDEATGVLTIEGTGEMIDYSPPWYDYKSEIIEVNILDGVTSIGISAFSFCQNLITVTIPDSVTKISQSAFDHCEKLTDVIIPNGVKTIGNGAFSTCTSLTSILIPDSVTSFGESVFYGCVNLASVIIGNNVVQIGDCAFYCCSSLGSVTLGEKVQGIHPWAFRYCNKLNEFKVSENNEYFTSDEYGVLFDKDKTKLIQFPANANITEYIIPNSVSVIQSYAFYACQKLTKITLPDNISVIYELTFRDCTSLESVSIPDNVEKIERAAFYNCKALSEVSLSSNLTEIGELAFIYCGSLKNIIIPDSVINIGYQAFESCESLESISLSNNLSKIDERTFYECKKLKSITIPDSVVSIEDRAFINCQSLTSAELGSGVETIGTYSFYNCSSLEYVIFPLSLTSVCAGAFDYCDSLSDVYYVGLEEEWNLIEIAINNPSLHSAKIHYHYGREHIFGDWETVSESTCESKGIIERQCTMCYEKETGETPILEHIEEEISKVEATCTESGLTQGIKCSICDKVLLEQIEIPATGHSFTDWSINKNKKYRNCSVCGFEQTIITTEDGEIEIESDEHPNGKFDAEEVKEDDDRYIIVEDSFDHHKRKPIKAYDINLKNDENISVQPNGKVKVKIPHQWKKDRKYKIYRVNEDGSLVDMNAYLDGDHIVFETNHFSLYVVTEVNMLETLSNQIRFNRNEDGSYAGMFDVRTRAMISDEDFNEFIGVTNEEASQNIKKVGFVYSINSETFSIEDAQGVAKGEIVSGYIDAPVNYIQDADGYYMFTCLVTDIPSTDTNYTLVSYAYICVEDENGNEIWYFMESQAEADFYSLYSTYYPVACEKYGWEV
ncbi:MAG: leucine-rich repeat domain-containing protein [Clostridia bacterium]|nr:leucine-rich repeat domain-containing protein [Clostridia bacterium]